MYVYVYVHVHVQSNIQRKDTLGAGLLSFVRKLCLSRRLTHTSLFNVKKLVIKNNDCIHNGENES